MLYLKPRTRNEIRPGDLIKLTSFDAISRINAIKLYPTLEVLRTKPFTGYQKHLIIQPNDFLLSMITDIGFYGKQDMIMAVQILCEGSVWWVHIVDVSSVIKKATTATEPLSGLSADRGKLDNFGS